MLWEYWNRWDLVTVNVAAFSLFLLLMPFRKQGAWEARGAYLAFLVALFTEMYGLPLTVYLITPIMQRFLGADGWLASGHLFGWPGIVIGTPVLILGAALIVRGWSAVHRAVSSDVGLVTDGVYGFVRHPQYLGLMLFALGWLVHWPTIIGAAMLPLLVLMYYRLARREERDLEQRFGEAFRGYRSAVPMLLPNLRKSVLRAPAAKSANTIGVKRLTVLPLIAVVLVSGVSLLAFTQQSENATRTEIPYTNISSKELRSMMSSKDFLLINVHIPYDDEIEGTDLFIPYNNISGNLDKLPASKDAKVLVYCRSGFMSAIAADELAKLGYRYVFNHKGGMIDWERSGYTLMKR